MFGIVGSVFRWIGMQLGLVKGAVDRRNDKLMRNPTLIRQEGDAAATELKQEYEALYNAIKSQVKLRTDKQNAIQTDSARLELVGKARAGTIAHDGKDAIEKLGYQLYQLNRSLANATKAMQKRFEALGVASKDDPAAAADQEFTKHKNNVASFLSTKKTLLGQIDSIESQLHSALDRNTKAVNAIEATLGQQKLRLEAKRQQLADLPGRVEETIAAVIGEEEMRRQEEVLASIDSNRAESRLATLDRIKNEALAGQQVIGEMTSNTIDNQYLTGAYANTEVDDEIDALLNPNRESKHETPTTQREAEQLPNG